MTDNPFQAPQPYRLLDAARPAGNKVDHGCMVAWLLYVAAAYFMGVVFHLLSRVYYSVTGMVLTTWSEWLLRFLAETIFFVCGVGLWRFKRWGFYGFVAYWLVKAGVEYVQGNEMSQVIMPFVFICLLFGLLQIGRPSTWAQLD